MTRTTSHTPAASASDAAALRRRPDPDTCRVQTPSPRSASHDPTASPDNAIPALDHRDHGSRQAIIEGAAAAAVLLINPKFPHNVGGALRACTIFGADRLAWTAGRVPRLEDWPPGQRLPREERMRAYRDVQITNPPLERPLEELTALAYTPVTVEVLQSSETLGEFIHPARGLRVRSGGRHHRPRSAQGVPPLRPNSSYLLPQPRRRYQCRPL